MMKEIISIKNHSLPASVGKINHRELDLFKKQKEINSFTIDNQPYTREKASVMFYRTIFFLIALLYLSLTAILFYNSFSWTLSFILGCTLNVRTFLNFICLTCAFSSFGLGYAMKAEKVAIKKAFQRAKDKLKSSYHKKAFKFNLKSIFSYVLEFRTQMIHRQHYKESLQTVVDYRDEAAFMMQTIKACPILDSNKKEVLLNQAIKEFSEKTEIMLESFNSETLTFLENSSHG